MENELQQIAALPNVHGAFVCDNGGEVIACSNPPVLASVAMVALGRESARMLCALEAAGCPASRIDIGYGSWRLLASDLGEGLLLAVCTPAVDASLVRMTADIAVAGWRKDGKQQKRLRAAGARRSALLTANALDDRSWRSWSALQRSAS